MAYGMSISPLNAELYSERGSPTLVKKRLSFNMVNSSNKLISADQSSAEPNTNYYSNVLSIFNQCIGPSDSHSPPPYIANMSHVDYSLNKSKAFKQTLVLPNVAAKFTPHVAMRSVIFDANNYIIPKDITPLDFIPSLSLPYHLKVNLKQMKICPQYNSKNGCSFAYCYRFHICQLCLCGNRNVRTCLLQQGIRGPHNLHLFDFIFGPIEGLHDNRIIEHLRREARINCNAELWKICNKSELICLHNIEGLCALNRCILHHIRAMFQWEISIDGNWKIFTPMQNKSLEKGYCNPKIATLTKQIAISNPLCKVLGQGSCTIDYEKFTIDSLNTVFKIRRLSTPSDIIFNNSFATRWLWYWQDESLTCHLYSSGFVDETFIVPLSDHIESLYLAGIMEVLVTINGLLYSLNLDSMTQTNVDTLVAYPIRRRPLLTISEDWNGITFRNLWGKTNAPLDANKEVNFIRNEVLFTSPEYSFVVKMLLQTLPAVSDVRVHRIENHFLWDRYQLKKKLLIDKYQGNSNAVNEQYLFHDSGQSNVDHVCTNNFDYSSIGVGLGFTYGRGLYFTNLASFANTFASTNEATNYKSIYVAFVLVGEAAYGDENMEKPPSIYPACTMRFDTTVNDLNLPGIFVKYYNDEFYPAYYVEYKD